MKAYKVDFDGVKFFLVEFDIKHEYDFNYNIETGLDSNDNTHNCNKQSVEDSINRLNKNMVSELLWENNRENFTVKKCKDCGKYFITNYDEWCFFKNNNLTESKRCHSCRRKRKHGRN